MGRELATYEWVPENAGRYLVGKGPVNLVRLAHIVFRIIGHLHAPMGFPDPGPNYVGAWCYILPWQKGYARARDFLSSPKYWMAKGLFKWRFMIRPEDPCEIEWMFSFYDEAIFAAHVYNQTKPFPTSMIYGNLANPSRRSETIPFDVLKRPPVREAKAGADEKTPAQSPRRPPGS